MVMATVHRRGDRVAFKTYEDPAELRKLQRTIMVAMNEFFRVCDELGIPAYIWAGSCIGVVRHGGYIPWDDDVDVALKRDDYERFLREAPALLSDEFELENARITPGFPLPFTYLAIKGTANVPEFFAESKWERRIGIDIFPLDKLSSDETTRKKQARGTWIWGRLQYLCGTSRPYLPFDGAKAQLVWLACGIANCMLRLFRVSSARIAERYERAAMLARDEFGSDPVYCDFSNRDYLNWTAKASELDPPKGMPFEETEVFVPNNCDAILTRIYGDYMQLPPVDQRKNHYPVKLDFGAY